MTKNVMPERVVPRKVWTVLALVLAVAAVSMSTPQPVQAQGIFSYAVKFVCGFNRSNLGILADGSGAVGGENVVKIGNYATDINIFNPNNDIEIKKKAVVLVKDGFPVGREPEVVVPDASQQTSIGLPHCGATYDDCNEILRLAGSPPAAGTLPGLFVGFLVIQSEVELDVTAVYTAEICSDFASPLVGPDRMCLSPPGSNGFAAYGAGLSIDVEQIRPTIVQ